STARRLVSMVEGMSRTVGDPLRDGESASHLMDLLSILRTASVERAGQRGHDLVALGGATGPGDLLAVGVKHEGGRSAGDAEAAHQLEVVLGVDLDVDHA